MNSQFKKISRGEVNFILEQGLFQKSQLTLNSSPTQTKVRKVLKVKLVTLASEDRKRIYVLPQDVEELRDKMCAFSFKIGTQVYFFKAKIKFNAKGFFVDSGISLYELARRQHIRFDAHPNYPTECTLVTYEDERIKMKAELLNISLAGASFRVHEDSLDLKKNKSVYVLLRPEKKAGFIATGHIRYMKKGAHSLTEVGIEFSHLDEVQKNKITATCEALSLFIFAN